MSLDPFAETSADYNDEYIAGMRTHGLTDYRADGTLPYISPSMSGLTAAVALVTGENNEAEGIADAWSAAVIYSNDGMFLTAAMESGDIDVDALGGMWDYDQWRIGGSHTKDAFTVGAMYANTEYDVFDSIYRQHSDHWNVFATYTTGNNVFKIRYSDKEENEDYPELYYDVHFDQSAWIIGVDHNFSARSQLSLLYVNSETDATRIDFGSQTSESWNDDDTEIFSVQLNHSF